VGEEEPGSSCQAPLNIPISTSYEPVRTSDEGAEGSEKHLSGGCRKIRHSIQIRYDVYVDNPAPTLPRMSHHGDTPVCGASSDRWDSIEARNGNAPKRLPGASRERHVQVLPRAHFVQVLAGRATLVLRRVQEGGISPHAARRLVLPLLRATAVRRLLTPLVTANLHVFVGGVLLAQAQQTLHGRP